MQNAFCEHLIYKIFVAPFQSRTSILCLCYFYICYFTFKGSATQGHKTEVRYLNGAEMGQFIV